MNFFGNCTNFYNYYPSEPINCCRNNSYNMVNSISIMANLIDTTYSTGYTLGSLLCGKNNTKQIDTTPYNFNSYYMMQNPMMYGGFMQPYTMNTPSYMPALPTFDFSTSKPTSYYLDLLNNPPQSSQNNTTDIENVNYDENGKKLNPFEAFEKMNQVAEDIGYKKSLSHDKKEHGVDMVNQQWRDDANAKKENVASDYKKLVKDFAKEFILGIDKKYGNGDGKLTYSEFEKYQLEDLPSDADNETKQAMKESVLHAFNRLNLNGEKTIDEKEISALLAAMDFDDEGNVNGTITVNDFTRVSSELIDKEENNLDMILEDRYKDFFEEN